MCSPRLPKSVVESPKQKQLRLLSGSLPGAALYLAIVTSSRNILCRLREPDSPKGGTLPRLHSRFRYSDRTLFQLRQGAYNSLPRPSTLTRRWSDRKRPAKSDADPEVPEPKIRRNEVTCLTASHSRPTKGRDLIGFSENCYFAEVEQFSLGKIILSKYVNTNCYVSS